MMKFLVSFYLLGLCLCPSSGFAAEFTNFINMTFVDIPVGKFAMGSCRSVTKKKNIPFCKDKKNIDTNASTDETPKHEVQITRKFQIGMYEVTFGQFKRYLQGKKKNCCSGNKDFVDFNNHSDQYPVVYVTWHDIQDFLAWLNTAKPDDDPGHYRLPTEAEWEYAVRAGSNTIFFFGNSSKRLQEYAWFAEKHTLKKRENLHEVGTKKENPWGLFDMYGNVWEWVADKYSENYYEKSAKKNPAGPASNSPFRVIRGGAWNFSAEFCRSAARNIYPAGNRSRLLGFRVVRELP